MAQKLVNADWMWHPNFTEERLDTAGLFVHFRKTLSVDELQTSPLKIRITADTRYKLYINSNLIAFGPVKGDSKLWFYDEVDITPTLRLGENHIAIQVLRFFHATPYAQSFPRLPLGGLMIKPVECSKLWTAQLQSSTSWQTAIDTLTVLPTNLPEDEFLHIYESHNSKSLPTQNLDWQFAKVYEFQASTGLGAPWKLAPRMIPNMRLRDSSCHALHNIRSSVPKMDWEDILLRTQGCHSNNSKGLLLEAQSTHHLDLEMKSHTTAFLKLQFRRPQHKGSVLSITYSESYEDPPILVPYLRSKGDRCDTSKVLYGPQDVYRFCGEDEFFILGHDENEATEETFSPFHFRTFRFLRVQIDVGSTNLVLKGIEITPVNYPLDISAHFDVGNSEGNKAVDDLLQTSIRTLLNCMHDCYEDCPFYEQLQYSMDMRSAALFTYYLSGDDRMARQALTQIHSSFDSRLGLTCSRAPCHQAQIIPHFSLYWICAVNDHRRFFGDLSFLCQFAAAIDGILEFFNSHIDPATHLVHTSTTDGIWEFTDWTEEWRPYGVPPAVEGTGVSTYTNCLYAYTLQNASHILQDIGRPALAEEYTARANAIITAIRIHCFDGVFFTDGLANCADPKIDYSVHAQVFAVLSGAASGALAHSILSQSLFPSLSDSQSPSENIKVHRQQPKFVQPSLSMSFYKLRALALAPPLYDSHFHSFFSPWRAQLALGLTTWEEDAVSQRSDCHAWGSVPIYEFLAEVAGVYPAEQGWNVVGFRPRLSLFKEARAKIPVGEMGVASVRWWTDEEGTVTVILGVDMKHDKKVPVVADLAGQIFKAVCGKGEVEFAIKLGERVETIENKAASTSNAKVFSS